MGSFLCIYKTSVSHFKVKNTTLKHTDGKGKFKRMLSCLLVDKGRLFFTKLSFEEFEIHEIFITADRSAWPVLRRNQAAKFMKNVRVHFVLYCEKNTFLNGNFCICQYFILRVLYILRSARAPLLDLRFV